MDEPMTCSECGGLMIIEEGGTSHHIDEDGQVDHDLDADHVAIDQDQALDFPE